MTPSTRVAAPLMAVALLAALTACAGDAGGDGSPGVDNPPTPAAGSAVDMVDYLGRELNELGEKMVQLAEAMPESTYDWAPMPGVRSVGAVYAHVAGDNYFVPALFGMPVEGTGVTTDSGISAYEEARGSKAEIVAELQRSFDAMAATLAANRTEPGKDIMLRDNRMTQGDLWVRAIVHLHEHLGQSIAYARANEVVPPWSAAN